MNDQPLMRVMDGAANTAEHFQSITDREPIVIAVFVDPDAFEVLHDQKREAVRSYFGAVQLRDVQVIEARQDLRFTLEMPRCFFASGSKPDQLERDLPIQLLVVRQINFPHSAAANVRNDFVIADALIRFQRRLEK